MNQNDEAYIIYSAQLIKEWAGVVQIDKDPTVGRLSYVQAIRDQAEFLRSILEGEFKSPWHECKPEAYLQIMAALGA